MSIPSNDILYNIKSYFPIEKNLSYLNKDVLYWKKE